jgi:hypothetical protein
MSGDLPEGWEKLDYFLWCSADVASTASGVGPCLRLTMFLVHGQPRCQNHRMKLPGVRA